MIMILDWMKNIFYYNKHMNLAPGPYRTYPRKNTHKTKHLFYNLWYEGLIPNYSTLYKVLIFHNLIERHLYKTNYVQLRCYANS